jgi:phosphoribosylpyrophosphate synthetase
MPDGSYFLYKEIVDILKVSQEYIDIQANTQIKEIERQLLSYRGSTEYDNEFEHKITVLVDDGIATGATIIASANWLKNDQQAITYITCILIAFDTETDSFSAPNINVYSAGTIFSDGDSINDTCCSRLFSSSLSFFSLSKEIWRTSK